MNDDISTLFAHPPAPQGPTLETTLDAVKHTAETLHALETIAEVAEAALFFGDPHPRRYGLLP